MGKNRKGNKGDNPGNIIDISVSNGSNSVSININEANIIRKNKKSSKSNNVGMTSSSSNSSGRKNGKKRGWTEWCYSERSSLGWVIGCAVLGMTLGFGIGTGHLTGAYGIHSPWRNALASKIRSSFWYDFLLWKVGRFIGIGGSHSGIIGAVIKDNHRNGYAASHSASIPWYYTSLNLIFGDDYVNGNFQHQTHHKLIMAGSYASNHPDAFAALRESIVREEGGYVHPDLGLLNPAPSGAARGLGMIRDSYHSCQIHCFEETHTQRFSNMASNSSNSSSASAAPPSTEPSSSDQVHHYPQETILLKIPLSAQFTRAVALHTLLPLLPHEVRHRVPLEDLDDAALLILLLAHERGRGRESRFQAYISTLPTHPTCGYSPMHRANALEVILALGDELGLDVNGWPMELTKSADYGERIAGGLTRDYGNFISVPRGTTPFVLIQWALCVVASRAIAGNELYGSLRLMPIADMINHDESAEGYIELNGTERLENGDILDATEDNVGAFVVRSMRHGRSNPLKVGQELLVNYNVPGYSPLDWFLNLGFVPPERSGRWTKMESALPRVIRRGTQQHHHGNNHPSTSYNDIPPTHHDTVHHGTGIRVSPPRPEL